MISANEDETFAFAITLDDKVTGSIGVFRQQNISNLVVVDENEESITLEADVKYDQDVFGYSLMHLMRRTEASSGVI